MSDPFPSSGARIYLNAPQFLRGPRGCGLGCMGILLAVFLLGGLFGLLIFGWKTLLGL